MLPLFAGASKKRAAIALSAAGGSTEGRVKGEKLQPPLLLLMFSFGCVKDVFVVVGWWLAIGDTVQRKCKRITLKARVCDVTVVVTGTIHS